MKPIIDIIEVGFPQSLIQRKDLDVSELIGTEELVQEIFEQLCDYKSMYDDAYNHACEYQQRAHEAESEIRQILNDIER
jgi:hypothetical protein